jgi:hemoglobin/transferrin/lactoferrin receptor protein
MRFSFFIFFTLLLSNTLLAQTPVTDSIQPSTLPEIVISATKFPEKKRNIAQKIELITPQYIANINAQNTGDLLMSTGNIFVQKSQQGGSSPVVRGFEASRVLLVVDGVRMNNLIYRSGHLQNVITVDQNMLEGIEIMYGPASTIFGSDALGGVVQFRTKKPIVSVNEKVQATANAFVRYSSANSEKTGHIDINIGWKKIAWLQSYHYSNFGDMRMGKNYPTQYPNFGRRDSVIETINGVDTVLVNSNNNVQRFSNYKQWDFLQKILFQPNEHTAHLINIQLSNSTDVPRYDRLQDKRNNTLRYASWYYGPQQRNLFAYQFNANNLHGWIDEIQANINYQIIEESRYTREFKRYDRLDARIEKVKVGGFVLDARKKFKQQEITVGIDGQLNSLRSTAARINIKTGAVSTLDTRYPDGDNNMNNFGAYVQHTFKIKKDKWVLNDGIRVQTSQLTSTIKDTSFFKLPYTNIHQNLTAVTGNIGLVYLPSSHAKVSLVFSSGFRAPNVDDVSKIFESSTSAKQLVVPNPNIKPERTYGVDMGVDYLIADKIQIAVSGFYTLFNNALVKAPFQLNGQDSVLYNGIKSQVLANQNKNKAYLYGFTASIKATITHYLTASSTINYTKGRYETDNNTASTIYQKNATGSYSLVKTNVSSKPLDHIPPVFGKTNVCYNHKGFQAEVYALYNGWKYLNNYNADGEDNAQYATADGMPSWFTLNLRSSYQFHQYVTLQAAVENILDKNYRYFASGFSAPGRNIMIAVRLAL